MAGWKETYRKVWNALPRWVRWPINRIDNIGDDFLHWAHGLKFWGLEVDMSRFMKNRPTSGHPLIRRTSRPPRPTVG